MPLSAAELATLNQLLIEVLDLEPAQRASWLEALPPQVDALRPTLRDLLDRADAPETHDFLHTLPKLDRGDDTAQATHREGDTVGPYRLLRAIGRGGMGAVWLAERVDGAPKRQVALKLPLLAAQPLMRQRLAIERDILAALEHPHIARLYDAGVDASGQPYLALEYVEGEAIDAYCRGRALGIDARLALFVQVASAVAHAHAKLVLHRDLKPGNILVTADAQARLLDFGIAKLLQDDPPGDGALTQMAGRALTPDYAAPEQILGQPMTVASDVYSLGVVLFELLTGERPYRLAQDSPAALADSIRAVRMPLPSTVATDPKAKRRLAGDLDTIVLKALKAAPAERYPTVNALIDDLERLRDGHPILARPDSAGYRLRKFVARNRLPVASAVAVLLAVFAGAGAALWQARSAATERDRALALLDRNQAALDFMEMVITEAVPVDAPVSRAELLERSERIANDSLKRNPEHLALVLSMLSSHYNSNADYAKSSRLIDRAAELVRTSPDIALRAEIECNRAHTIAMTGRPDEGKQAISGWLARGDLDPALAAQCQLYLAQIALAEGRARDALEQAEHARRRLATLAQPPALLEASALAELAYAESLTGRNDLADRDYAAALKIYRDLGRDHGSAYLTILNNWALAAFSSGDIRRAHQVIEETLRLSDPAKAPAYVLSNMAGALLTLGRLDEALAQAQRAYEQARRTGAVTFEVLALMTQSNVHRERGDLATARQLLDAAAAASAHESAQGTRTGLRINQARLQLVSGDAAGALARIEPVAQQLEVAGARTATLSFALRVRGEARWQRGDLAGALADARRAVDIARDAQAGKPHSYVTGLSWLLLGRIEAAAGQAEASRRSLQAALDQLSPTLGDEHRETRRARDALLNPLLNR